MGFFKIILFPFLSSFPVCDSSEVSVNGVCMPKRAVGLSCEDTAQCQGGSICERGLCKCPRKTKEIAQQCIPLDDPKCGDRHVKIANECFPMVSLGRSCVHSAQCMGMGACIDGVCDCPKNTQRKVRNTVFSSFIKKK